ncbi:hypothetical protein [Thioalkalivibrio sp.]|uniref:hypothetical protein n=1 Tax=Thioalkalivibrio sp. TaxID=2093813 RepID=UPI0012D5F44F|nr:hypothetical protein [Thioalkalivibrio sp.]TVP81739.1 MAG: hypothetical protein EA346_04340 [Thioalkalivibrio sp.]
MSFVLWRWTGALFWRVVSPGLLVAGTMMVAAGAYQHWLVTPVEGETGSAEQNRVHNDRIQDAAVEEHSCPGGHRIVVAPGDPERSGDAGGLTLEVFLLSVDETEEALRLAAARPNQGLMSYPALEEFRSLLEGCFGEGDTLDGFLENVEREA